MGSGDLNAKKSWHVVNLKNQRRVWEAEQQALAERKKTAERVEELRKERQEEDLARQLEAAGGQKRVDRVEWMYQGPSAENGGMVTEEAEAFLLGKRRIDGLLRGDDHKQLQTGAAGGGPMSVVTAAAAAEGQGGTAGGLTGVQAARDLALKIREDPLLAIKRREQQAFEAVANDPLRRRQLLASMGLAAAEPAGEKTSGHRSGHRSSHSSHHSSHHRHSRHDDHRDGDHRHSSSRHHHRSSRHDDDDSRHHRSSRHDDRDGEPRHGSRRHHSSRREDDRDDDDDARRHKRPRRDSASPRPRRDSPSPIRRRDSPSRPRRDSPPRPHRDSTSPRPRHDSPPRPPPSDSGDSFDGDRRARWRASKDHYQGWGGDDDDDDLEDDLRRNWPASCSARRNRRARPAPRPAPRQEDNRDNKDNKDNSADADERARRLAAMQADAAALDTARAQRLAAIEAREAAARAADDRARAAAPDGRGALGTSLRRRVGEMGLAERLERGGRQGLQRVED